MPYRIFLSHTYRDYEFVKALAADASAVGIDVYAFERDSQPGKMIAAKVLVNIKRCDALIAVLTRHGASSAYVQQEVGAARSIGKLVIPIVETGVSKSALAMLEGVEYIPLDGKDLLATRRCLAGYLSRLKWQKEATAQQGIALLAVIGLLLMGRR